MPLLHFEYTNNLPLETDLTTLFSHLHHRIAQIINGDINKCKSRVTQLSHYYIGETNHNQAFTLLTLEIFSEMIVSHYDAVGTAILQELKTYLQPYAKGINLQICVHVKEIQKSHYYKDVLSDHIEG